MNFIKFLFEVWKSGSGNTLISTNRSVIVLVLVQQSLQRAGSGTEAPRLTGLVGRGEKRPGPAGRGEQGVGLAGLAGLTQTGPLGLLAPSGRDWTGPGLDGRLWQPRPGRILCTVGKHSGTRPLLHRQRPLPTGKNGRPLALGRGGQAGRGKQSGRPHVGMEGGRRYREVKRVDADLGAGGGGGNGGTGRSSCCESVVP